ncbi:MAG: formaldehyde-activating enzyme [Solirubrobacteraceae bacterium]
MQPFGPAQAAVAGAVVASVDEGVIPARPGRRPGADRRRIHPLGAEDDKEIYDYNYGETMLAISRALGSQPSVDKVVAGTPAAGPSFADDAGR